MRLSLSTKEIWLMMISLIGLFYTFPQNGWLGTILFISLLLIVVISILPEENVRRFWEPTKLFLCFIFPFLPLVPTIGRMKHADCVCSQAYGRNNYHDSQLEEYVGRIVRTCAANLLDCMIELRADGFNPGKSNLALGQRCLVLCKLYNIDCYAQWEVIYAMYELDPHWFKLNTHRLVAIWPEGKYFATWHVLEKTAAVMASRQKSSPILVANPSMTPRVVATAWRLGLRPIVEGVSLLAILTGTEQLFKFDQESVQPWTKSFLAFLPREVVGRYGHLFVWAHYSLGVENWLKRYPFPAGVLPMIPGDWVMFTPPSR